VLGVYPKLATDAIDPASEAVVARVAPAGQHSDVGEVVLADQKLLLQGSGG
jgi:hypothetical protein